MMKVFLLLVLLFCSILSASAYSQTAVYSGSGFFNNFNFWNYSDPTHGYVYYASASQAWNWGLVNTNNGQAYIGADSWSVSTGSGRAAVRIQSNANFNTGLFVLDLDHMPTGCGTWPAFWMVGPNWPNGGEIDIVEGVDNQMNDLSTLHTSEGCDQSSVNPNEFTGTRVTSNCWNNAPNQGNNQGCGISSNLQNYGAGLNNQGGGYYVTEWQNDHISIWFYPHGGAPPDLLSGNPNPSSWDRPVARWDLGGNCDPSHFSDMNIVINLTFCGDWDGAVFGSDCPGMGDCNSYVQNNPSAFADAYWLINSITIYN